MEKGMQRRTFALRKYLAMDLEFACDGRTTRLTKVMTQKGRGHSILETQAIGHERRKPVNIHILHSGSLRSRLPGGASLK